MYIRLLALLLLLCTKPLTSVFAQSHFSAASRAGCAPHSVRFESHVQDAVSWKWDFGNGAFSTLEQPSVVYLQPGVYTVKLITWNAAGQTDTLVQSDFVSVYAVPLVDFQVNTASGCPQATAFSFTNLSQRADQWTWHFGDGTVSTDQHPTHRYALPGTYTVKLIASNGEGCSAIKQQVGAVTVLPITSSQFSVSSSLVCEPGLPLIFTASPGAAAYQWSFGDGTVSSLAAPVHNYTAPGTYSVSLLTTHSSGCTDTTVVQAAVTVKNRRNPVITASEYAGCAPVTVQFSSTPHPEYAAYQWDFGDGTVSAQASPGHIYSQPGTFQPSLTVTTLAGCTYSSALSQPVFIPPAPQVAFTASGASGCAPYQVTFQNQSSGAVRYEWDYGNGVKDTTLHGSHTYVSGGHYPMRLTAINAAGCSASVEQPIIVSRPVAEFTSSATMGCGPLQVQFTGYATDPSSQYRWYFGDGATSSQANPVHVYQTPGTYHVALVVSEANGCSDSIVKLNYITVVNPAMDFTTPPVVRGCAPFNVMLSDSTLGAIAWEWDLGDGTLSSASSVSHQYNEPGEYVVSLLLKIGGGCTQYYPEFRRYRIGRPEADWTADTSCTSIAVQYHDASVNATSWFWQFGDGTTSTQQNPLHLFPFQGVYSTSLTVTDSLGCSHTQTIINEVTLRLCAEDPGVAIPSFAGSGVVNTSYLTLSGCVPYTARFRNPLPAGYTLVSWDFGDGASSTQPDVSHTYSRAGWYDVRLIYAYNGTQDTVFYRGLVKVGGVSPGFRITRFPTCVDPLLEVQDQSSGAAFWDWNFGDGHSASVPNPSHQYQPAALHGSVDVIQRVTDTLNCSASQVQTLFESAFNYIWADMYQVCNGEPVQFHFTSSVYASYHWDFGDGHTSSAFSPAHQYTDNGSYTVVLTVTDPRGCSYQYRLAQPVTSYIPQADFAYLIDEDCGSTRVQFTGLCTGTGLPVEQFTYWQFGNGAALWASNPVVNYPHPGVYEVTVAAYAPAGCLHRMTRQITVGHGLARFSTVQDKQCLPVTLTCTDESEGAVSWLWDFGDGQTSNEQHPVHVFTTPPSGPVKLIITDIRGCTDTLIRPNIDLYSAYAFSPSVQGCVPYNASFNASASDSTVSWHWDFGDGTSAQQPSPTHTYTQAGVFTPVLTVIAADGCSDTLVLSQVTTGQVTALFSVDQSSACAPATLTFHSESTGADTYVWDFGNGNVSAQENPQHLYTEPGVYDVSLVASSVLGCSDTLSLSGVVTIKGPVVGFEYLLQANCNEVQVQFTDTSSGAVAWNWNFGDGNQSNQQHPSHSYTEPGSYDITLEVTDASGCTAFIHQVSGIQALPEIHAQFEVSDSLGCAPFATTFRSTSQGAQSYYWDFGDGTTQSTSSDTVFHTYVTSGNYTVMLIAHSAGGCSDTAFFSPLKVAAAPDFSMQSTSEEQCAQTLVHFQAQGCCDLTYQWLFSNGQQHTGDSAQVLFGPGTWDVSLIASYAGCSDTLFYNGYIHINDTLPIPEPYLKRVTVIDDYTVGVEWHPVPQPGITHYEVYREVGGTFVLVGSTQDSSYTETGLATLSNVYCYLVKAVDGCNRSAVSRKHCTVNIESQLRSASVVHIEWTPYMGASVTGYRLYRYGVGSSTPVQLAVLDPQDREYFDTLGYCTGGYFYRVHASGLDQSGLHSASDSSAVYVSGITMPQFTAELIRSTVHQNEYVLTEWKESAVLNLVAHYNLYRSEDSLNYILVGSFPPGVGAYLDRDVDVHRRNYYYLLETVNICDTPQYGQHKSSSVFLQSEKLGDMQYELRWTAYRRWDSGVAYYEIQKLDENGQWIPVKRIPGNVISTTIEP